MSTIQFCSISGHELDRPLENSSSSQSSNSGAWQGPIYGKLIQIWTGFPEIDLAYAPIWYKNWKGTHKNWWMNFPEICLCHEPENWSFGKIFGMRFPGFSNKGSNCVSGKIWKHCERISQWLLFRKSKTEFFRIKMNLISLMVDLSKIREQKCFAYAKSLEKLQWNSISGKMHFVCPTSEASPSGKQWGWFSNSILLLAEALGGKFENRYKRKFKK